MRIKHVKSQPFLSKSKVPLHLLPDLLWLVCHEGEREGLLLDGALGGDLLLENSLVRLDLLSTLGPMLSPGTVTAWGLCSP